MEEVGQTVNICNSTQDEVVAGDPGMHCGQNEK